MNQKESRLLTPRRIVITLSVVLGLIHVILLGWTLQRQSAAEQLAEDKLVLEENLSQLEEINQEQLDTLQEELEGVEEEIVLLKDAFPELGAPFALYRQGLEIAQSSGVDLITINLLSSGLQETVSGNVLIKQYNLEATGTAEDCLEFIKALEEAGEGSLNMDAVSILPADKQCLLDLSSTGFPAEPE